MSVIDREQADVLLEEAQQDGIPVSADVPRLRRDAAHARCGAGARPRGDVTAGADGVSVAGADGLDSWASEQVRSMVGAPARPALRRGRRTPREARRRGRPSPRRARAARRRDVVVVPGRRRADRARHPPAGAEAVLDRRSVARSRPRTAHTCRPSSPCSTGTLDGALEASEAYSDDVRRGRLAVPAGEAARDPGRR